MLIATSGLAWAAQAGEDATRSVPLEGARAAPATVSPQRRPALVDLDAVVVSGAQPGPGLWTVHKGDHVMHILGTLSPLPKRMDWQSVDVERVVATSQEVLDSPSVSMGTNIGMFRGLLLMPSLLRARRNPDGRTLSEVVPAAQYARWRPLKLRYIGRGDAVEEWRPIFAAYELYKQAIEASGLSQRSASTDVVKAAARRGKARITPVQVTIPIKDPKRALREFASESLDDLGCFDKTLGRIEHDLGAMVARANAWAIGDIDALRAIPFQDQFRDCADALTEAGIARKQGMGNLDERLALAWIGAAETALARNERSFASLPINQLLRPDGYLARLRAKGYAVQPPKPRGAAAVAAPP